MEKSKLEKITKIAVGSFAGLGIGLSLMYIAPAILPSFKTETKINGDKIEITKRKGAFSTITYIKNKDKNEIEIYNFSDFSKSHGLIALSDYNKDSLVDKIYYSDDPLTGNSLIIKRDTSQNPINVYLFKEADKIYKEEIEKFE